MDTNRKNTIIAGALCLLGFISGILSIAYAVDDPEYLIKTAANVNQTLFAALFQFVMIIAYLGIAIILYPIIKKFNERLALGFLSFRIIGTVFILIGVIILLLILTISQDYVREENSNLSMFQLIGGLLRTSRDYVNHIAMIVSLNIGGIMLYLLLYKARLVPTWLSVWGIIGAIMTITASFLIMFRLIDIITPEYMIMNVPIALQELTFAIWLIFKGFDKKVLSSLTDKN
jgi:hypothetical protein